MATHGNHKLKQEISVILLVYILYYLKASLLVSSCGGLLFGPSTQ